MQDPNYESRLTQTHLPRWRTSTTHGSDRSCASFSTSPERVEAHAHCEYGLLWLQHPTPPGFIGLQSHTGTVVFRRFEWKAL
jgi:hypothetical protein